jgi:hypothetical protein
MGLILNSYQLKMQLKDNRIQDWCSAKRRLYLGCAAISLALFLVSSRLVVVVPSRVSIPSPEETCLKIRKLRIQARHDWEQGHVWATHRKLQASNQRCPQERPLSVELEVLAAGFFEQKSEWKRLIQSAWVHDALGDDFSKTVEESIRWRKWSHSQSAQSEQLFNQAAQKKMEGSVPDYYRLLSLGAFLLEQKNHASASWKTATVGPPTSGYIWLKNGEVIVSKPTSTNLVVQDSSTWKEREHYISKETKGLHTLLALPDGDSFLSISADRIDHYSLKSPYPQKIVDDNTHCKSNNHVLSKKGNFLLLNEKKSISLWNTSPLKRHMQWKKRQLFHELQEEDQLLIQQDLCVHYAEWSEDKRWMVFFWNNYKATLLNLETKAISFVTSWDNTGDVDPKASLRISPDGRFVVFPPNQIFDTANRQIFTNPCGDTLNNTLFHPKETKLIVSGFPPCIFNLSTKRSQILPLDLIEAGCPIPWVPAGWLDDRSRILLTSGGATDVYDLKKMQWASGGFEGDTWIPISSHPTRRWLSVPSDMQREPVFWLADGSSKAWKDGPHYTETHSKNGQFLIDNESPALAMWDTIQEGKVSLPDSEDLMNVERWELSQAPRHIYAFTKQGVYGWNAQSGKKSHLTTWFPTEIDADSIDVLSHQISWRSLDGDTNHSLQFPSESYHVESRYTDFCARTSSVPVGKSEVYPWVLFEGSANTSWELCNPTSSQKVRIPSIHTDVQETLVKNWGKKLIPLSADGKLGILAHSTQWLDIPNWTKHSLPEDVGKWASISNNHELAYLNNLSYEKFELRVIPLEGKLPTWKTPIKISDPSMVKISSNQQWIMVLGKTGKDALVQVFPIHAGYTGRYTFRIQDTNVNNVWMMPSNRWLLVALRNQLKMISMLASEQDVTITSFGRNAGSLIQNKQGFWKWMGTDSFPTNALSCYIGRSMVPQTVCTDLKIDGSGILGLKVWFE